MQKKGLPASDQAAPWGLDPGGHFPMVDASTSHPVLEPIFGALKNAGSGPLNIHRIIANAPDFYAGFSHFATVLRGRGETSRAERELAIHHTVLSLGARYESIQHRRIALKVGLNEEQVDNVLDWRNQTCFDERQTVLLELAEAVLKSRALSSDQWQRISASLTRGEVVEIALTTAFYSAVSQLTHVIPVPPEETVTNYGE